MNQPLLLLSNMSNMMIVKLDNTNYIVWKHQITMVLETYSMFEFLDETQLVPDKFSEDLSRNITVIVNPNYLIWRTKEKALLTFISSTLSPSILALRVGCTLLPSNTPLLIFPIAWLLHTWLNPHNKKEVLKGSWLASIGFLVGLGWPT